MAKKKKKKDQLKVASNYYRPDYNDRSYGGSGPGSLLDRRDADHDRPLRGYPSDKEYPSGTFPLAKKKKKKKNNTRTA